MLDRRRALPPVVHQGFDSPRVEQLLQQQQTAPPEPATPPAPSAPAPAATPPAPDRPLNEGGMRALEAERTRAEAAERKLAEYERANNDAATQKKIDDARAEAAAEAKRAAEVAAAATLVPLQATLVMQAARAEAITAGVAVDDPGEGKDDRVTRFLRVVDLKDLIGADGVVDAAKLKERITAAATANPEFVVTGPRTAAPGGPQGATAAPPADRQKAINDALEQMQRATHRTPAKPA